jgi:hypothetical protein
MSYGVADAIQFGALAAIFIQLFFIWKMLP